MGGAGINIRLSGAYALKLSKDLLQVCSGDVVPAYFEKLKDV